MARVSARTGNREVGTLQNMLNKAVAWGRIASKPIADVKPLKSDERRKERRSLSVEEVEEIFRKAPEHLKLALRLFCSTGLRRGELVDLRFDDVDFEGRYITVRASVAKSRKAREIPLDDYALGLLKELREQAKRREPVPGLKHRFSREHVFVTKANTPRPHNLLRAFYAVCKRAGIDGAYQGGTVDLHSLRVTFTTLALENGASPKAVQAILGHSTLGLTMTVYAKATERAKRDAISALPFAKASVPEHVVAFPGQSGIPAHTSSESSPQTFGNLAVASAT
jgi:integrase